MLQADQSTYKALDCSYGEISWNSTYCFEGAHSKEVCHHGAESRSKTGLCDESKFELCEADHVVPLLPVPAGDVQQVGLVVVLHQLDDHADVVAVVLDRDHPHDVGSVLCVRVLAVLVRQHKTGVSLVNLWNEWLGFLFPWEILISVKKETISCLECFSKNV